MREFMSITRALADPNLSYVKIDPRQAAVLSA